MYKNRFGKFLIKNYAPIRLKNVKYRVVIRVNGKRMVIVMMANRNILEIYLTVIYVKVAET